MSKETISDAVKNAETFAKNKLTFDFVTASTLLLVKSGEHITALIAENKKLQTIIDNRAEDKEVLRKYKKLRANIEERVAVNIELLKENKRLREALEKRS